MRSRRPSVNPDQTTLPLDSGPAWVVYALCDPRETDPVKRVRYVGKTKNTDHRLAQHISESRRGEKTHKCNWIRSLLELGLFPLIEIIDPGSECRAWDRTEVDWIKYYQTMGARLTNGTKGGDGVNLVVARKWSEEERAKHIRAMTGHEVSQQARERIGNATRARMMDPEQRRRISERMKNRVVSEETRKKIADANRARTAESRERMGQAQKQRFTNQSEREKISATKLARNNRVSVEPEC